MAFSPFSAVACNGLPGAVTATYLPCCGFYRLGNTKPGYFLPFLVGFLGGFLAAFLLGFCDVIGYRQRGLIDSAKSLAQKKLLASDGASFD